MTTDAIAEIDRLKAELDDLRPLPPDATGRLAQKLRIEWNYHSNAIEGNALTLGETRTLILHGLTARGKPMRDHLDIEGHDDAVKAIEEAVGEGDALNQAFIRNLHSILLKEPYEMPAESPDGHRTMRPISVGQYRTMPNNVRTQTGEMHYFAPPDQVQSMMSDLIDWCRAKEAEGEHAVVVAATFHYRFVQIHPFDDGNGRMARLLTNLILMRHGYTIAMVQRDGRDQYIAEIEQAQATGIGWIHRVRRRVLPVQPGAALARRSRRIDRGSRRHRPGDRRLQALDGYGFGRGRPDSGKAAGGGGRFSVVPVLPAEGDEFVRLLRLAQRKRMGSCCGC